MFVIQIQSVNCTATLKKATTQYTFISLINWASFPELLQVSFPSTTVKSTVDYIMVRQEDKAKVPNVKVI